LREDTKAFGEAMGMEWRCNGHHPVAVTEALRPSPSPSVSACSVDRAPRKNPQPSDHAPVVVTLG
jgi:hypothetical protein